MKKITFLLAVVTMVLKICFASCNTDAVTRSDSLTKQLTGGYGREYQEEHENYVGYTKDSIYITAKDKGFEVRNVKWYKSVNRDGHFDTDINGNRIDTIFTKVKGFGSFSGIYNKIDTTISRQYGSSIKLLPEKEILYFINRPDKAYKRRTK